MTYPAHEDCNPTDSIHHVAICKEIGERIWTNLDWEPARLPPRLIELMERLRNDRLPDSTDSGA